MKIKRRKTRVVRVGRVLIGGNNPVVIQSMAKEKTSDTIKVIGQIRRLESLGCQLVRLAVKDADDAKAFKLIKPKVNIPLVADIHFDWRLAIKAIECGADKIRLNPGNIYKEEEVIQIARLARRKKIPIRVGLNSGSLPERSLHRSDMAASMVKSALGYIKLLEKERFYDIVVSLKASNILDTLEAYRLMAKSCDYPFHLGVTASGAALSGAVKSAIAIGCLLLEGIGDTIRVSLTEEPQVEIRVARNILESLGLGFFGPRIISCPTCGRCEVNLVKLVNDFESRLQEKGVRKHPKIALMGCVVNGPGEAKEADLGVAFGKKHGLFFKKGKLIRKIPFNKCISVLIREIK